MAFQTKYMTFAVHEEKPNEMKVIEAIPDLCIEKLLIAIEHLFERCKSKCVNIITSAIISDLKFLHPGDAKKIASHIKKLGGIVEHSFGPVLRIKTQDGYFITMYQLGGANPVAAEMVYPKPSLAAAAQDLMDDALDADDNDLAEVFNLPS